MESGAWGRQACDLCITTTVETFVQPSRRQRSLTRGSMSAFCRASRSSSDTLPWKKRASTRCAGCSFICVTVQRRHILREHHGQASGHSANEMRLAPG